jgi:lambda family phage tail tape measure protein
VAVGTQDLKFRVLASVVGAQAIDDLKKKVEGVEKSTHFLKEGVKLLAEAFAVEKVVEYGKGLLETADRFGKMSQKTGIAVETLAGFAGAAELADVPLESLGKGLNKLSLNIVQAANGNIELAGTFKNLGINLRDSSGNLKNSGQVVKELGDKFQNLRDGPEKAAIAIKLFGKSGADLIPFLNEGSEQMEKFGLAISQDFSGRATAFLDTIKEIGFSLKNGAIKNLEALLPTLQELADAFLEFTKSKSDTVGFMEILGEAARVLAIGIVTSFQAIKTAIDAVVTTFKEAKAIVTGGGFAEFKRLEKEFDQRANKRLEELSSFVSKIKKNSLVFGDGTTDEILARRRQETAAKKRPDIAPDASAIGENLKILKQFDEKIAKIKAEAAAIGQSNVVKQAGILIAELESKGIAKSSKAYGEYKGKILDAVTALETAKEKQSATDFQRKEQENIELQRLQILNYDKSTAELQKLVEAKQLDNQATEATIKFTEEGRQSYLDATEAVKAQKAALVDLQEQQKRTWSVGAKQALNDYLEHARNVAAQVRELFAHAFQNMEDSLVAFVKTGKLDFTKFADDVITDLIRIQVRAALVQAITGAQSLGSLILGGASAGAGAGAASGGGGAAGNAGVSGATYASSGFAKGGIMSAGGPIPLRAYAGGGVATSPQLALFGEGSRPEAYVPLPDGRSIPVSMKSGGNANVSVVVNMGGSDSTKADSEKGAQLGKMIASAVRNEIIQQKRPGGALAG